MSQKTIITVGGMTCGGCANSVRKALLGVPGVTAAEVDLAAGRAAVEGTAAAERLIQAVEAAGFDASRQGRN